MGTVAPNAGVIRDEAEMARLLAVTSPARLAERARDTPDEIAFRDKHLGIYQGTTWREYAAAVEEVALADGSPCCRSQR